MRPQKFVESTIEGYILGKKDIEQSNNEHTKIVKRVGRSTPDYSLEISNSTWEIEVSQELKLPTVLIIFKRQHIKNLNHKIEVTANFPKESRRKGE